MAMRIKLIIFPLLLMLTLLFGPCSASATSTNVQQHSDPSSGVNFTNTTQTSIASLVYLSVRGEAPDLLGIGAVSGFYGPGSTVVFYILELGSWVSMVRHPHKSLDLDTAAYLGMINIASGDLILKARAFKSSHERQESNEALLARLGSIGAPVILVWWGFSNAFFQMYLSGLQCLTGSPTTWKRPAILGLSSVLPAIALFTLLLIADLRIADVSVKQLLPSLRAGNKFADEKAQDLLSYATAFGLSYLVWSPLGLCYFAWTKLRVRIWEAVHGFSRWLYENAPYPLVVVFGFVSKFGRHFDPSTIGDDDIVVGSTIPSTIATVAILFWPAIASFHISNGLITYVAHHSAATSCFMMPCTTVSMLDLDQAAAVAGAFVGVIVLEMFVPLVQARRRKRKQRISMEIAKRIDEKPWATKVAGQSTSVDYAVAN